MGRARPSNQKTRRKMHFMFSFGRFSRKRPKWHWSKSGIECIGCSTVDRTNRANAPLQQNHCAAQICAFIDFDAHSANTTIPVPAHAHAHESLAELPLILYYFRFRFNIQRAPVKYFIPFCHVFRWIFVRFFCRIFALFGSSLHPFRSVCH